MKIADRLFYPVCKNHGDKIARYRIMEEEKPTFFLCEECTQRENSLGNLKFLKVIKAGIDTRARGKSVVENFLPAIKRWAGMKKEFLPELKPPDEIIALKLLAIWELFQELKEESSIFGGKIPCIRILNLFDNRYYYFTHRGDPLMSSDITGEKKEFYPGYKKIII
jgi:hypothetical protein